MKPKEVKDITAIFREGTPIDRALAAGAREAIRRHKQAGVPMAVWRNGNDRRDRRYQAFGPRREESLREFFRLMGRGLMGDTFFL